MSTVKANTRRALQVLALLGILGAGLPSSAQTQSCAPLVAAANANFPGLDQRLKENAQLFDSDFLRERIARAKPNAKDEPAKALTVCVFEQELASRSSRASGSSNTAAAPSAVRDDPKVFGRGARGG